jgi:hypothetical protein
MDFHPNGVSVGDVAANAGGTALYVSTKLLERTTYRSKIFVSHRVRVGTTNVLGSNTRTNY